MPGILISPVAQSRIRTDRSRRPYIVIKLAQRLTILVMVVSIALNADVALMFSPNGSNKSQYHFRPP